MYINTISMHPFLIFDRSWNLLEMHVFVLVHLIEMYGIVFLYYLCDVEEGEVVIREEME